MIFPQLSIHAGALHKGSDINMISLKSTFIYYEALPEIPHPIHTTLKATSLQTKQLDSDLERAERKCMSLDPWLTSGLTKTQDQDHILSILPWQWYAIAWMESLMRKIKKDNKYQDLDIILWLFALMRKEHTSSPNTRAVVLEISANSKERNCIWEPKFRGQALMIPIISAFPLREGMLSPKWKIAWLENLQSQPESLSLKKIQTLDQETTNCPVNLDIMLREVWFRSRLSGKKKRLWIHN